MRLSQLHARLVLFLAGACATVLWGLSFVPGLRLWRYPNTTGLEWLPALFATPLYLLLVVPAVALAIFAARRGLLAAAALMAVAAIAAMLIFID